MQPKHSRRCRAVEAYTGGGKRTFLTQLRGPIVAIDAAQRRDEVLPIARAAGNEVFRPSEDPTDALSPDALSCLLMANMPGSGIATITVDTLTPIIAPLIMQAMRAKVAAPSRRNRPSGRQAMAAAGAARPEVHSDG
jgi:hypothetical protein